MVAREGGARAATAGHRLTCGLVTQGRGRSEREPAGGDSVVADERDRRTPRRSRDAEGDPHAWRAKIRTWLVTDAAAHDGARLREGLIDRGNTSSEVWADTAYRSQANEAYLAGIGKQSRIHRKKPAGKPMAKNTARANAAKSKIRRAVEHPF